MPKLGPFEIDRKSEPFDVYNDVGSPHPFAAKPLILAALNCGINDGSSFCGAQAIRNEVVGIFGTLLTQRPHPSGRTRTGRTLSPTSRQVLPPSSVGEMTLRLYGALSYSQSGARDLRCALNRA